MPYVVAAVVAMCLGWLGKQQAGAASKQADVGYTAVGLAANGRPAHDHTGNTSY